jgi:hypothetical protein
MKSILDLRPDIAGLTVNKLNFEVIALEESTRDGSRQ